MSIDTFNSGLYEAEEKINKVEYMYGKTIQIETDKQKIKDEKCRK